jgi:hypothetical protein
MSPIDESWHEYMREALTRHPEFSLDGWMEGQTNNTGQYLLRLNADHKMVGDVSANDD